MSVVLESVWSAVVVFVGLLYVTFWWLAYGRFKKITKSGPQIVPFVGHFLDLKRKSYQLHLLLHEYYKKYGPVFSFNYQGESTLVVAEEKMIKQILIKQFANFQNRKFFVDLPWPCHNMITMVTKEKWKFTHLLLKPVLAEGNLKKIHHMMQKAATTYAQLLETAQNEGKPVDVVSHSQGYVMQVLLEATFSMECANQSQFNKTLISLTQDFVQPAWWTNLIAAFPFGQHMVKYIPSAFKNKLKPFIDTANGIVTERRSGKGSDNEDILNALLNAQKGGPDKNGNVLLDEAILAQGITVLTAVHVATSTTLAAATYYIAKHKDVQNKIYEEIKEVADDEEFPSWEHVKKNLKYLEMVLKETMRLVPSGFMLMRECTENCTVEGIEFTKGSSVLIPTYSLHRAENYWMEPEKFNPDRFSPTEFKRDYHYMPYGEGARMCLGSQMAMLEMKSALAQTLHKYEISLVDEHEELDIKSHVSIQAMLTINAPVMVQVKKR